MRKSNILPVNSTISNVSIVGPKGQSFGQLFQTKSKGLVSYTGSTLPGYSGAGYYANGALVGIHLGTTNQSNIGVTANTVLHDIRRSIIAEAGAASWASCSASSVSETDWDDRYEDEDEDLYDAYTRDSTARGKSYEDWKREQDRDSRVPSPEVSHHESLRAPELQLKDELYTMARNDPKVREMIVKVAKTIARKNPNPHPSPVYVFGQDGTDDKEAAFALTVEDPVDKRLTKLEEEIGKLQAKVQALEAAAMVSKPKVTPAVKSHKCSCGKSFVTQAARMQHQVMAHGNVGEVQVAGETAIKSNSAE